MEFHINYVISYKSNTNEANKYTKQNHIKQINKYLLVIYIFFFIQSLIFLI